MPKGYAPAVFVSSTCFDLSQVRADLRSFIDSIGYDPVLSEFNNFPVNPDYDAIGNCLEVVKAKADIFVLIVGGRYGCQVNDDKSVTNLEYIEAKAKSVPIYIFVKKDILNIFPIWQKNKSCDFSGVVDSNKLFEFIELLKSKPDNWIFPFETAQDIVTVLLTQFSYFMMEMLEMKKRYKHVPNSSKLLDISPRCLEIATLKPFGWEYRLFAQILKDGIMSLSFLKNDLRFGVAYGKSIRIEDANQLKIWFYSYTDRQTNIVTSLIKLLNEGFAIAAGEPGVEGDIDLIYYVGKRMVEGYKLLLDIGIELYRLHPSERLKPVIDKVPKFAAHSAAEVEEYAYNLHKNLNHALDNHRDLPPGTEPSFKFILTAPDITEFTEQLALLGHES